MSKRDDLNELYKPSGVLGLIEKILFIINVIAGIVTVVFTQTVESVAIYIQIVVAFLYFLSNIVDDGCFWYEAEKQRRKNGVQDGMGTRLSEYETEQYYNNMLSPSLKKYGLNILESNYFSKKIAGKMMVKKGIFELGVVVTLLLACICVRNENMLLVIGQTFFSSYILINYAMLVLYKIRMDALYNEAYNVLILGNRIHNQEAWIISYIMEYEAIKAHYKIRLDSNIFNKLNGELTVKWNEIVTHRVDKEENQVL